MGRLQFGIGLVAALGLAACSSLSLPANDQLRALDYATDDVANLVIAFDMPETLEPMPEGPTMLFDVTSPSTGVQRLRAELERADADEAAGALPPPGDGRVYYLFSFSDADKSRIRELQAAAKAAPQGQGGAISIGLEPRFCATKPVDPNKIRFSVLIALPGATGLRPLVQDQQLAAALNAVGGTLPACEGHSG